jgi:hypothetical protein
MSNAHWSAASPEEALAPAERMSRAESGAAREVCSEETRGFGRVLASNNIAAYPRQTKANQNERGTRGMGSNGRRWR